MLTCTQIAHINQASGKLYGFIQLLNDWFNLYSISLRCLQSRSALKFLFHGLSYCQRGKETSLKRNQLECKNVMPQISYNNQINTMNQLDQNVLTKISAMNSYTSLPSGNSNSFNKLYSVGNKQFLLSCFLYCIVNVDTATGVLLS